MQVHHIGYLVRHLEKAKIAFLHLGYTLETEPCFDTARGVRICFVKKDACLIELVEPNGETSVVSSLLKRYKNSPYHVCYTSPELESDTDRLREQGFMPLGEAAPASALNGCRVIFFVHPDMGMIELVEEGEPLFAFTPSPVKKISCNI